MLKEHQAHIDQAVKFASTARSHGKSALAAAIDNHVKAAQAASAAFDTGNQDAQVPATKALFDSIGAVLGNYEPGLPSDVIAEGRNTLRSFYDAGLASL